MNANNLCLVLCMLATLVCSTMIPPLSASATGAPSPSGSVTPANNPEGTKVNINSADVETLCTLKGIGPQLAQRIKEFREQHGPFKKVEDITAVRGVGETILEWNRNLMDIK